MYSLYWLRRSLTSSFKRSSTASSSPMTSSIFSATRSGLEVSIVPAVRLFTSCLEMYETNSLASSMLCARTRSLSRIRYDLGLCACRRVRDTKVDADAIHRQNGLNLSVGVHKAGALLYYRSEER